MLPGMPYQDSISRPMKEVPEDPLNHKSLCPKLPEQQGMLVGDQDALLKTVV